MSYLPQRHARSPSATHAFPRNSFRRTRHLILSKRQSIINKYLILIRYFPELVGKAKKKILKIDERDLENFKTEIRLQKYHLEESEPQPPGQVKTHTDYYKEMRRERLDHRTSETNKLIIRLDQLLNLSSFDRKQEEQKIVPWIEGAIIDRCPSCTAPFNITRRQHHCRLCGSIMCHNCSHFLQHSEACNYCWVVVDENFFERIIFKVFQWPRFIQKQAKFYCRRETTLKIYVFVYTAKICSSVVDKY